MAIRNNYFKKGLEGKSGFGGKSKKKEKKHSFSVCSNSFPIHKVKHK